MAVTTTVVGLCVLGVLASATSAQASEPNETQVQATGPFTPGVPADGAIEVKGDQDWYFFYTAGPAQLTITVSNTSASSRGCFYLDVQLSSSEGAYLGGVSISTFGAQRAFSYAAPQAGRYYLRVRSPTSCDPAGKTPAAYTISIDPPSAITTGAAAVAPPAPATAPPPYFALRRGYSYYRRKGTLQLPARFRALKDVRLSLEVGPKPYRLQYGWRTYALPDPTAYYTSTYTLQLTGAAKRYASAPGPTTFRVIAAFHGVDGSYRSSAFRFTINVGS